MACVFMWRIFRSVGKWLYIVGWAVFCVLKFCTTCIFWVWRFLKMSGTACLMTHCCIPEDSSLCNNGIRTWNRTLYLMFMLVLFDIYGGKTLTEIKEFCLLLWLCRFSLALLLWLIDWLIGILFYCKVKKNISTPLLFTVGRLIPETVSACVLCNCKTVVWYWQNIVSWRKQVLPKGRGGLSTKCIFFPKFPMHFHAVEVLLWTRIEILLCIYVYT